MPKVYMNEAPVVQTVGAGGIGVSPPAPIEKVEKISGNTRGMEEVVPPVNRIPNPSDVGDGAVIKEKNKAWQTGTDLPDPTNATDGMVLAVEDGKYIIADSSVQTDVADLVADPYDPNSTYDVGDIVVYENKLYVCKTAIATAEAWTAAHWDEKNMAEIEKADISELKSAINQVDSDVVTKAEKTIHFYDYPWNSGYIGSSGSVVSNSSYFNTDYIRTDAGDSIEYEGLRSPSASYPIVACYDKSKAYMSSASVSGNGTASQSGTFTVPNGCEYVRFITYYFYEQGTKLDHITMPMYTAKADANTDAIKMLSDPVELMQYTTDGFDQFNFSITGKTIKQGDGSELAYTYMDCTDFISTDGMVSITASIKALNKYSTAIGCYDTNKNYIKYLSLYPSVDGASSATWQTASGTITIDNTVIKYIRIAIANNPNHNNDTISVLRTRTLKADYLATKDRVTAVENEQNPWKGKNWFVFGTSMSDDDYPNAENDSKPTGVFPKYLQALSGMVQFNHGKAGGTIATGGPYSASGQIYSGFQHGRPYYA